MKKRTFFTAVLSLVVCFCLLFSDISSVAAILTFETQYDYESADTAWLTDLVIKEDMETVSGMADRTVLVAKPDYPYVETPTSFENDIAYYCSLYSLDEDAQRAAYIYLLSILGTNAQGLIAGLSDAEIKEQLELLGVAFPEFINAEELIIAKALYASLVTGTLSLTDLNLSSGVISLEEALVAYLSQITGMNLDVLKQWMPTGTLSSLDDYIVAASKVALWTNGYDVSAETPSDEIYKLMAVMTIEQMGIAVSNDLSVEELQAKYTAAMLGLAYDVSVDPEKLAQSIEKENTAFYMLQLIGQSANLSIREDNCSYLEAFYLVAENTDVFNIEEGEFYADIKKYSVTLKNLRESIWVYPTAYATGVAGLTVTVKVDGKEIENNYYNEIALDTSLKQQTLELVVECVSADGTASACTYYIEVNQGEKPVESESTGDNTETETFESSDSIVTNVLDSLGLNVSISTLIDGFYSSISNSVTGVVALIAPTFGTGTSGNSNQNQEQSTEPVTETDFISILDQIGAVIDTDISGIGGISLYDDYTNEEESMSFVTFD
ncbi:MAG: hypothetical protein IKJ88_09190 [Clostridia bacterium]|nr:hypothetical protein [Clostridia bacterium]